MDPWIRVANRSRKLNNTLLTRFEKVEKITSNFTYLKVQSTFLKTYAVLHLEVVKNNMKS